MRTVSILLAFTAMFGHRALSQNLAPHWSLDGNNNASAATSKLGTTNNVPLRLFTNNLERLRIDGLGRIGIGIVNPTSRLSVLGIGSLPAPSWISAGTPIMAGFGEGVPGNGDLVLSMASNNPNGRGNTIYRRSRGTLALPEVVTPGDYVGSLFASGFDGTAFRNAGALEFIVDAPATLGNVPTGFVVSTGTNPSTRDPRLTIASNGNVAFNQSQLFINKANGFIGVGNILPEQRLHVSGNGLFSGNMGVGGLYSNTYALSLGTKGTQNGIGMDDPVDGYILFASKSGLGEGIYVQKTSSNSSTPVILGTSSGSSNGVEGISASGTGVYGASTTSNGVYGASNAGIGVYGSSGSDYAGQFVSNNYRGIYVQSGAGALAAYFNGDVYATGVYQSSDKSLKKNIRDLDGAMDIIRRLQPKHYEFRNDGAYAKMNLPGGSHYGLLAQDVAEVLPGLVKNAGNNTRYMQPGKPLPRGEGAAKASTEKGEDIGVQAVNYTELVPILVKALQEQEERIAQLEQMVNKLSKGQTTTAALSSASMGQITPNPVRGTASIRYAVPEGSGRAQILVTDALGRQIRSIQLSGSGVANLDVSALSSGVYTYSLVVDGKRVETKKMTVVH